MKRIFFIVLAISLCACSDVWAQNFKGRSKEVTIEPGLGKLKTGESLVYNVEWMGISAGKITFTVKDIEVVNNQECYHIVTTVLPNSFFRLFYDVEYKVDTYIDTKNFNTLRFERARRLNKEYLFLTVNYEPEKNLATYTYLSPKGPLKSAGFPSLKETEFNSRTLTEKVPKSVQDLLSCLYYFRHLDIKEGETYPINVNYERNTYAVELKVGKPFLREIRKKGSFPCLYLFLETGSISSSLGLKNISLYLSADPRRIPLSFSLSTNIGLITGSIQDIPG